MAKTNITKKEAEKIRSAVDTYIAAQKNNTFNYKQVSHAIGVSEPLQQRAVALYLSELAFDDKILEVAPGKYKTQPRSVLAEGTFSRRSNGKNSVIIPHKPLTGPLQTVCATKLCYFFFFTIPLIKKSHKNKIHQNRRHSYKLQIQ